MGSTDHVSVEDNLELGSTGRSGVKSEFLVTAVGEDRPGIVARLTEVFFKCGANLEESRMAILGGEFAAIMLLTVSKGRGGELIRELKGLEDESISISTKPTSRVNAGLYKGYIPYEILLSGADHEGIVHRVSSFLHGRSINIQTMETGVVNAPVTGTPLFSMKATVQVPPSIPLVELRKSLSAIGDEESVDIEVRLPSLV